MQDLLSNYEDQLIHLSPTEFEQFSLKVFDYQSKANPVYHNYLQQLNRPQPKSLEEIPFLPIELFKQHHIHTLEAPYECLFESSGTTGNQTSRHYIKDSSLYKKLSVLNFEKLYGPLEQYNILALLPSYLERGNSSLVFMVDHFMSKTQQKTGYYLDDFDQLITDLKALEKSNYPTLLIGVTYALIDIAEAYPMSLKNTIVMETGGMKGRKKEQVRQEIHAFLKKQWQLDEIHSEYGMTELLSQAYAKKEGKFELPNWMHAYVRNLNDPFDVYQRGRAGKVCIVDLANIESCAFIETGDLGRIDDNGFLEVLGRVDHSDIRGCSLLYTT